MSTIAQTSKAFCAFVLGALAAAATIYLSVEVRAQSDASAIHICIVADGTLRTTQPPRTCDPGQRALTFLVAGAQETQADADTAALERTLRDLEQQVADLERSGGHAGPSTVTAPFEVTGRGGNLIFSVDDDAVHHVYGTRVTKFGHRTTASLDGADDGGRLAVTSTSDTGEAVTIGRVEGSGGDSFGLRMSEAKTGKGLELGRGVFGTTSDMYKLVVAGSARAAAIGQSEAGSGIIFVANQTGDVRARMFASRSHGIVDILNKDSIPVAAFQDNDQGGLLLLTSSGGEPMVDAGVHDKSYGMVRAGPASFKLGLGSFGLPGSFIMGKPH
ncbi:MAG TPA: hypothetical protein VH583_10140 [Vicinamibacterales bacterium]|jgi:hypothetical protein